MNHNTELLISVYQDAELGRDVMGRLIRDCEDDEFRNVMAEMFAEYHRILSEAERLLFNAGSIPKPAKRIKKLPIFSSISMNVKIDRSSSHLAEMLLQGSLMSYIDLSRDIRFFPNAYEESKNLAWRLITTEENNMQRLKQYI